MGRAPCCDKANVKRGPWSPEEDAKLKEFIDKNGTGGNWIALPQKAGLKRCGKSCRLRWLNYLRPHIKHGEFSVDEDQTICTLYANIGSRWSIIAAQLPGRTDNDIKNYWNTKLKKKLMGMIPSFDQRKTIPSFSNSNLSIQTTTMPQSQLIYADYYYTPSMIKPNNIIYDTSSYEAHHTSTTDINNNGLISPMQFYPGKDNMLMFGGAEPSCSSSDGSCSQISYGKEIKQEENMNNFQHMQLQGGFISNGGSSYYDIQECNKLLFDHYGDHDITTWGDDHKQNTINAPTILNNNNNSQLQYDLEEVKQLISSSSGCNSTLFFNDDKSSMFYYG